MGGYRAGSVLIGICFAFLYKKNTVDKIESIKGGTLADMNIPQTGADDFENGICDCFSDPWVCIHVSAALWCEWHTPMQSQASWASGRRSSLCSAAQHSLVLDHAAWPSTSVEN